jgi:hypothetical protein
MQLRRMTAATGALLVVLALGACQGSGEPEPEDDTATTASPQPTDEPTDEPGDDATDEGSGLSAEALVQGAVDDLAAREDADAGDIQAGQLEQVTWPDGSLGCPIPGQAYTQALIDGTRLVLTLDGTDYAYHGQGEEPLEYCAEPTDPVAGDTATG